ncbi:MAG TPA: efflux RND transporter periplasmic adaptor subunit [Pusillimonas sp.]|uniref:efflux RND transporter periplasmic adaptor subunit n=1 Tax=unclassified Pusillimonas TaxID=2640016 RepID=UPI002606E96B|nr:MULTISPECIES: efflux RND transporter periplasmic adaptor subunit [unclassified Pusillimonas]HLU20548.1 efflux RND transporter periplasmic adaptor subunit [Pusillimonas sp.]
MKSRVGLVVVVLMLAVIAWLIAARLSGVALPAYEVAEQPLVQTVVATGRVSSISRAQVGSTITGVVVERRVREGDKVKPGDILAVLRADDLEAAFNEAQAALAELQQSTRPQADAALRETEAALDQAQREARRRRELFKERAISREELERATQAEAAALAAAERARLVAQALASGQPNEVVARARVASARAQLDKTIIRSEVSGTVLTRNAEPGDLVQPSRVLFEIARDDEIEVLVPLDERNLEVLELGQTAVCIADAYPSQPFNAKVRLIAPSVDPQRGTVDIRLLVEDPPEFLRQDMTVSVNVETGRRDRAVVVPNDALAILDGDRAEVWVVAAGRSQRRAVQLGLRGLTRSEVTQGLQSGDIVLADGRAGTIRTGERVRPVLGGFPTEVADTSTRKELPMQMD